MVTAEDLCRLLAHLVVKKRKAAQENYSLRASQLTEYQTNYPSKKGETVYVLSREIQSVYVIDDQNKVVSIELVAGESKLF